MERKSQPSEPAASTAEELIVQQQSGGHSLLSSLVSQNAVSWMPRDLSRIGPTRVGDAGKLHALVPEQFRLRSEQGHGLDQPMGGEPTGPGAQSIAVSPTTRFVTGRGPLDSCPPLLQTTHSITERQRHANKHSKQTGSEHGPVDAVDKVMLQTHKVRRRTLPRGASITLAKLHCRRPSHQRRGPPRILSMNARFWQNQDALAQLPWMDLLRRPRSRWAWQLRSGH